MSRRFSVWLCAVSVVAALANARPVAAHGVLVGANPAPNSMLTAPPTRIELRFNEEIDARLSRVILTRGSMRVALRLESGAGRILRYEVPAIESGAYIVDWRVISSVDGHLTRGTFAFGVGTDVVPAGIADTAGRSWPDVVIRWLGLIGAMTAIGVAVGFGWLPAGAAIESTLARKAARLVAVAAGLVVMAGVARVWLDTQAVADVGRGPADLLRAFLRVLGASPNGHDAVFRMTGAFFLARLLRRREDSSPAAVLAIGTVLLIGPTLTSHGLTTGVGGALLSFLHLAAASVWVGGLIYFGFLYLPVVRTENVDLLQPAAARFSRLALTCVVVLAITGAAQAWLYAGPPSALSDSTYGRTLIAKLVVVAPLLLLAALNRWHILPRLRAAPQTVGTLGLTLRAEAALAMIVVILAAAIAITTPATTAGLTPPDAGSRRTGGSITVRDGSWTETGRPAPPGQWSSLQR